MPEAPEAYAALIPGQALTRLYALAVSQQGMGRAEAAIETYRRCLALSPNSPEIHNNLGTALDQAGQLAEAVECFRQALALDPSYVRPLINLGKALRRQGKASEATAALKRALTLSPDNPLALTNLGLTLADQGRRQEAIIALRRATALDPGLAEAHHALGSALFDSGEVGAAVESLQRAVTLKPALTDASLLLAMTLLVSKRYADALAVAQRVLQQSPKDADALSVVLNCSSRMCDWSTVERTLEKIRDIDLGTSYIQPFLLLAISDDPRELLRAAARRATNAVGSRVALPHAMARKHEKIRVAYISRDFYAHATSFLMAELLELHDRSAFEVLGVSFGPDDQSPARARVHAAFDECLEAANKSDLEIATWLREHEVDIAVDLKGYTAFSRTGIFACRPAPLQVSYLGYPGTMGASFIDYLIADPFVVPEAEREHYTETIAYLPDTYQANDRQRRVSEHVPTRTEVGLPEESFVFCCFNVSWKITASVFNVWMRLLASVPGSVLWLLEDNQWAMENLRREATGLGIDPQRLIFCGRVNNDTHLARHRLADLFLDTFPCNAHTTASDALWMGLPVVTCAGRTFASRVAGSLLRASQLPELITASLDEYETLALQLAHNPERLGSLRARLTHHRDSLPLFDTPALCGHLEAAYRKMWILHGEGRAPEMFSVERLDGSGSS
jgi:protein O-GlcNAc transferase